jgi:hypothetical protein
MIEWIIWLLFTEKPFAHAMIEDRIAALHWQPANLQRCINFFSQPQE